MKRVSILNGLEKTGVVADRPRRHERRGSEVQPRNRCGRSERHRIDIHGPKRG